MATSKKATGKALVNWDEELAKRAAAAASKEKGGEGSFIGTRGGILKYQGVEIPGNKLKVIVLHSIHENKFYPGKFDPNNTAPPTCYAFGEEEGEMRPHEDVEEPQSDICATCPMNAWGSGSEDGNPRGPKACKNTRRIAVIPASALKDGIAKAEIAYVSPPVTSVKAWKGYIRSVNETFNVPLWAVITEISLVPDSDTQFKMKFDMVSQIGKEHMEELMAASDRQADTIAFPYPPPSEAPPAPPPRSASKVRGKAAPAPARRR